MRPRAAVPTKLAICVAAAAVLSGVPGSPGRGVAGDPAAPGISRLARAAVGIGKAVARRHVHQDERRQRHAQPARFHILNGGDDRLIGRRAAISGVAVALADRIRGAARRARRPTSSAALSICAASRRRA